MDWTSVAPCAFILVVPCRPGTRPGRNLKMGTCLFCAYTGADFFLGGGVGGCAENPG